MALWSLKGKKILIIDDFAEMRSNLRNMLIPFDGSDISTAGNGDDAIAHISQNIYDIILCDYNLGEGKDGQQVLEEAKLRGQLPYSTVFLMVTAESTTFMVMGALEHQPDDYLTKPFNASILQKRLKKALDKKSNLKELTIALQEDNKKQAIELCDLEISSNPGHCNELVKLKTELLIDEQRYDEALEICDDIISERNLPWAKLCKAKVLYMRQEYENAKQYLEEIISENHNYVSAYDWLAKTELKLGNTVTAQKTIEDAIEYSPKSVTRQRMLAETAETNEDFITAEKARRRAIRTAKNSVLSDPDDFIKLAEAQIKNDSPKDSLKSIERVKLQFKHDEQAQIAATLSKSKVFKVMQRDKESAELIDEVSEMVKTVSAPLKNDLALEVTESFLAHDKADEAQSIVEQLVSNNHDNQKLLDKVGQVYKKAGSDLDPTAMVDSVRKEIRAINNKGVRLLEAGNIDEAIELFDQALGKNPDNQALNINSAQAYIMKIKSSGPSNELLTKARTCLEKTANNKNLQQRYKTLNAAYWKFSKKHNTTIL